VRRRILSAAALATTLTVTAGAVSHAQSPAPPADQRASANPTGQVALSNETTKTRWAYAIGKATAYATPSSKAHRRGKLRFLTEDGFPEVYIVLSSWRDSNGTTWVHIRLPQRPNEVTGWVVRTGLGDFHLVHTQLVVNKKTLRVTLYKNGKRVFQAPVGIGKSSTPTPSGHSWIREKFHVSGNGVYGPRAMGTATYSNKLTDWPGGGVVGMHGTNEPGLVPGRPSHGCIRLHNADIIRLYQLTPVGTPVRIRG
jgi:hypothetical protein